MTAGRRYFLMDLFAGCGGMTRGFRDTCRFQPVFAVESDFDAAETYELNHGKHVARRENRHPKRIEEIDEFPKVDVVIGGPPCQGFSTLNRYGAGLERRGLWREYVRALETTGAAAFVMEQVPQLLEAPEYRAFRSKAKTLGYCVDARVLNAADFGVPQKRRRAFVIGMRGSKPVWPDPSHADPERLELGLRPWQTFRDAVAGLPSSPNGANWHRPRHPRPESLIRYKAVPANGGNRFDMERNLRTSGRGDLVLPCFARKRSGTTDVFGRLWWDRPAVTIRTEFYKPEKGRYLHPEADRPITVREAARLMSFSDEFVFPATQSMTSVGRQLGNAVPPLLAARLAETIAAALDEIESERRAA